MVLSLPFILAFIGSAAGLLFGILIFSEVSEAIECPSGATVGGNETAFIDTLGATSDTNAQQQPGSWLGQRVATSGEQITSITINDMVKQVNVGNVTGEIWTGATTDIDSATLVGTSNTINLTGAFDPAFDFTVTFSPPVTVSDPNTFIALHASTNWDSDNIYLASSTDIGPGLILAHSPITNSGFFTPVGFPIDPPLDMLIQVNMAGGGGGGPAETGSEQCLQAKETAWTVIGIIPVALFFALFAIFSALGTGRQG